MRIFSINQIPEALEEIKRDLAEMGWEVYRSYQSSGAQILTREYMGYQFMITGITPDWKIPDRLKEETQKRWTGTSDIFCNLYNSLLRAMPEPVRLAYTYPERIGNMQEEVKILKEFPYSRQLAFPVYFPADRKVIEKRRVPCTLSYSLQIVKNELVFSVCMRSCSLSFLRDDLELAISLASLTIRELELKEARVIFYIANLHEYQTDLEGVF